MNEKEKEAIELIKYIKEHNSLIGFKNTERRDLAETVLNLIEKQDKLIDLMAEQLTTPLHSKEWVIEHYNQKIEKGE